MSRLECPCTRHCKDRVPPSKNSKGCRATCEKFKQYEIDYKIKFEEDQKKIDFISDLIEYNMDKIGKYCKERKPNKYGK